MTWTGEWTATAIAAAVTGAEVSREAATEESLRRIAERDRMMGAFVAVRPKAVEEARSAPGGPLAGVPIAIKDNVPVEGEPMRIGSAATSVQPQAHDHPVVTRLRAAGAVVVGLTAVPELCVFGTTDGPDMTTRNPWNPMRTPGGSSGGAASAVAAGMVPVAHAADGMGSIRIPAACTGLVGIKPGQGAVPAQLGVNDWFGLSENGVVATTVADAALVLSVMAARPDWAQLADLDRRLSIGVALSPPVTGVRLDAEMGRAATRAASLLAGEGHTVERTEFSQTDVAVTAAAIGALSKWFAGTALEASALDRTRLQPRTRVHAAIGRVLLGTAALNERPREMWRASIERLLAGRDLLITPALAAPPLDAVPWHRRSWVANVASNVRYAPYAAPWNLAGYPAMVVPMGIHPDSRTPVAAQLVARPGAEPLLLAVSRVLEALNPWPRVAPAFAG